MYKNVEHPEVVAKVLINSVQQAWEQTIEEIFITKNEYIEKQQEELKGLMSEISIECEASKQYYLDLETWIKKGNRIPKKVYDSLDSMQQYHFNKHYNYRGDRVY